jgi:hypothetical protein
MSDVTLDKRRRGDERLMLTLIAVERLCAERVPASVRLEAALGPADPRSLVVPLAWSLGARSCSDGSSHGAAHVFTAA